MRDEKRTRIALLLMIHRKLLKCLYLPDTAERRYRPGEFPLYELRAPVEMV